MVQSFLKQLVKSLLMQLQVVLTWEQFLVLDLLLEQEFQLHQLSTGELLRKEIKDKTQLGVKISSTMNSGNLVSDEIAGDLIEKFISNNNYNNRLIFQ